MLYPLPLRFLPNSLAVLYEVARDAFEVDPSRCNPCDSSGQFIEETSQGHRRIFRIHPKTPEHLSRYAAQRQSRNSADAAVAMERKTRLGQLHCDVELEGRQFILTCVEIPDVSCATDITEFLPAYAEYMVHRYEDAHIMNCTFNLAHQILSAEVLEKIARNSEKVQWVEEVLDDLALTALRSIDGLATAVSHGDGHIGNFIITKDQNNGLLPSQYAGNYPQGYDLAVALWSLLQAGDIEDTMRFCTLVSRRIHVASDVVQALSDLIVLRCLWWLGLRAVWREQVAFEQERLIELHLEFALNVRVLQNQFQMAFSRN